MTRRRKYRGDYMTWPQWQAMIKNAYDIKAEMEARLDDGETLGADDGRALVIGRAFALRYKPDGRKKPERPTWREAHEKTEMDLAPNDAGTGEPDMNKDNEKPKSAGGLPLVTLPSFDGDARLSECPACRVDNLGGVPADDGGTAFRCGACGHEWTDTAPRAGDLPRKPSESE